MRYQRLPPHASGIRFVPLVKEKTGTAHKNLCNTRFFYPVLTFRYLLFFVSFSSLQRKSASSQGGNSQPKHLEDVGRVAGLGCLAATCAS